MMDRCHAPGHDLQLIGPGGCSRDKVRWRNMHKQHKWQSLQQIFLMFRAFCVSLQKHIQASLHVPY